MQEELKMESEYFLAGLYAFLIYWVVVLVLNKRGVLQRYNIAAFGPILMLRTTRGQKLLEWLARGRARERFWRAFANIGTVLVFFAMVFMFALVVLGAVATFTVQPELTELHSPKNWLLIPGLNDFIPLCAWFGFVVALVVHELAHAVLSTVEGIKVKSMGLLVAVVPVGAFAEPDSEQLFGEKEEGKGKGKVKEKVKPKATARERTRILAAGVTSNFFVAFLAFALFFSILSAVQPVSEEVLFVQEVVPGSTAEKAGLQPGMFVTKVKNTSTAEVNLDTAVERREAVVLSVLDKTGKASEVAVEGGYESEGVRVVQVVDGFPAADAGICAGTSIIKMDGVNVSGYRDFRNFMQHTVPGQTVEVQTKGGEKFSVKLAVAPNGSEDEDEAKGFLGVSLLANNGLGICVTEFPTRGYLEHLRSIPSSLASFSSHSRGWLWLTALPFLPPPNGFRSFNPLLSHFYEPVGTAASFLGDSIFVVADLLFWVGWINFYVGLFNCLPAVPLDGGYVFRELLNPVLRLGIKDERRKEKVSKAITAALALFVAASIAFTLVGPRLL